MDTKLPNSVGLNRPFTDAVSDTETKAHSQIDAASASTKASVDGATQFVHNAVDKTGNVARNLATGADDTVNRLSGSAKDAVAGASASVRDNPLVALGVALGVGYILGRLHR
jgi:ElaB/YqjD/DUF883 family membrane-anchored ribosome-binding protein